MFTRKKYGIFQSLLTQDSVVNSENITNSIDKLKKLYESTYLIYTDDQPIPFEHVLKLLANGYKVQNEYLNAYINQINIDEEVNDRDYQTLREYQRFNKGDATYVWLSNRIAGKKTPFVVDEMPKKEYPLLIFSLLNGVYFWVFF